MSEKELDALRHSICEEMAWDSVWSLSVDDNQLIAIQGDRHGGKAACAEVIRRPIAPG